MKNRKGATSLWVILGALALIAILGFMVYNQYSAAQQTALVTTTAGAGAAATGVGVQPTATYSTVDKYSTTTVSGTSYYQQAGLPASTTALTNVNPGVKYTYWVSNGTYYVLPFTFDAGLLSNPVVNKNAYANTSATLTVIDAATGSSLTSGGGANNVSGAANAVDNIQIKYTGGSKASAMPFGGVMAVEYKNTVSSVTCTGADIVANPHHVTYSVSSTSNTFSLFGIANTLDKGDGSLHEIDCNIKQGGSAASGSTGVIKFIPANYYTTNDGNIVLDTEKNLNADNTRTGLGQSSFTFGFT